ncbi:NCS2 family permease [Caldibacillus thermolactis]|jgi:adenine/guanine/hypoxanthine permease|uniref:NCS2 family permease n=1 Tax=Pallidibacillus thermolactis TaxID=251051 RepID=A0ABT2WEW9_9BACI|nr:NCS2 family permease [Pallidibacillus thermolactis]MCU9594228.1 NCS2 family permease [Pallidibacillus thermolactis]MCU9601721.1 NCS2 family permease [Pallidibacillus thermolactis subsp. kokeshiiformis]MED1672081.1 NCS2 family permease [Pallidibacillus thermolactis subsp. kokeshiiformis]
MKKYFEFDKLGTDYRTEIIAGLTTFLSMAYILAVNPMILSETGMDWGAIFTATCLAAALGTLVMGIVAKYPVALAPGMGLNTAFTFTAVLGMGIPWETALSGVLVSGVILVILTLTGIREIVINAIPENLKLAVGAGIGLFIAFIGLKNAGIVTGEALLGDLSNSQTLLAIFGLVVTILFLVRGVKAGIFYGMVITAIVGMIFGLVPFPDSIVSAPPSIEPTFGQAIVNLGNIFTLDVLIVILTFMFIDFFDTAGTLVAVASEAKIMENGKLPRAGRALASDSSGTVIGAILGTSSTTSYVESTAGVGAGGKSGFTAVVVSILFFIALFFSPVLSIVTSAVTSPALIIVGILMAVQLKGIEWENFETAVPAFFTFLMMPLTGSIATGIAVGFVFYPITMLVKGRAKEIHPVMYVLGILFILYFIFETIV